MSPGAIMPAAARRPPDPEPPKDAPMPVLMQVNFEPGAKQARETQDDYNAVAQFISGLPGFRWKIWIQDPAAATRGGIYLFDDLAAARAFGDDQLGPRLREDGATNISIRYFAINEEASAINHAPLTGRVETQALAMP
jgi:hypothetical protein